MYGYYMYMQDATRERINDLIKEAETERHVQEFLKVYPEYRTSARLRAAINRIFGCKSGFDDTRGTDHALQQRPE